MSTSQLTISPIPPPEVLAVYEQVSPGSAKLLIEMAVKQGDHRRMTETTIVNGSLANEARGMWMGFGLGLAGLIASTIIAVHGHAVTAGVIASIDLVSLVSVFVTGKRRRSQPDSPSAG